MDRWEAGQTLGRKLMLNLVALEQKGEKLTVDSPFIEGLRSILKDSSLDKVCVLVYSTLHFKCMHTLRILSLFFCNFSKFCWYLPLVWLLLNAIEDDVDGPAHCHYVRTALQLSM